MKIDLHLHTSDRSPCSDISISELIAEAKRIGLDGFCLTEHQSIWPLEETEELARNEGIRIFSGNEITSAQGDVLVYGLEKDIKGVVPIKALQKEGVTVCQCRRNCQRESPGQRKRNGDESRGSSGAARNSRK